MPPKKKGQRTKERTAEIISGALFNILFESVDINFQTRCFGELGSSNQEEIANILATKLSAMK